MGYKKYQPSTFGREVGVTYLKGHAVTDTTMLSIRGLRVIWGKFPDSGRWDEKTPRSLDVNQGEDLQNDRYGGGREAWVRA